MTKWTGAVLRAAQVVLLALAVYSLLGAAAVVLGVNGTQPPLDRHVHRGGTAGAALLVRVGHAALGLGPYPACPPFRPGRRLQRDARRKRHHAGAMGPAPRACSVKGPVEWAS